MNEEKKNLNEQKLSADELEMVAGGSYNGCIGQWNASDEKALQDDFATNGAGMSFDEFLSTKGLHEADLLARDKWIRYGSRSDSVAVASRDGDGYRVENIVAW